MEKRRSFFGGGTKDGGAGAAAPSPPQPPLPSPSKPSALVAASVAQLRSHGLHDNGVVAGGVGGTVHGGGSSNGSGNGSAGVDSPRQLSPRSSPSPLLRRLSNFVRPSRPPSFLGKPGRGHRFATAQLEHPTWCDTCDDVVWGLLRTGVVCTLCSYTCHSECQAAVTLDCSAAIGTGPSIMAAPQAAATTAPAAVADNVRAVRAAKHPTQPNPAEPSPGVLSYLAPAELRRRIAAYNAVTKGAAMELMDKEDPQSRAFKGFIRVTLNLSRPIKVATGEVFSALAPTPGDDGTGSSSSSGGSTDGGSASGGGGGGVPSALATRAKGHMRRHSSSSGMAAAAGGGHSSNSSSGKDGKPADSGVAFYLPRSVSKGLFLTSSTPAHEVISILLTKFKVVTPPRKFALFERNTATGATRRLRRLEEPLVLVLLWGANHPELELSLQEAEHAHDVAWDDFARTELESFLRILAEEEAECVAQIEKRYEARRHKLEEALAAKKK